MTGEGETTYDIWNGRAHIVCNTHTRDGAMRDVDALRPALENRNFSVSTSAGALTGEAIRRAIAAASKEDYSQVGCLVLILSSHGGNNVIYGSDDSSVPLEWVSDQFRTSNCRSLDRKPRIILVQACRGNGNTPLADGRTNLAVADGRTNFTVDHCFFIAYATTPTHYAWRTTEGSPFLQAFVQQLGKEQSLSHMFHLVNCSVAKTFNSTTTAQCVQIVDTLPYSVEFSGEFAVGVASQFLPLMAMELSGFSRFYMSSLTAHVEPHVQTPSQLFQLTVVGVSLLQQQKE
ncbi:caspase 7 [Pelomyxa schiedti]|nr:caspase 7 [Pelomyxa schiedti]